MSRKLRNGNCRGRVRPYWVFRVLAAAWVVAGTALPPPVLATTPRPAVDSLVILHTNDIHSHLLPFRRADTLLVGGAAARAALIERERARIPDLLLLDAGDVIQGTPAYNIFRGVPDTKALSAMGYDVVALGNHDLDDGPSAWLRLRPLAAFPVVSANVFAAAESSWAEGLTETVPSKLRRGARWIGGAKVSDATPLRFLATPYVILPWHGLKVAVLGLTTGQLTHIVRISANRGVAVVDPIAAARHYVPILRSQADLVIAVTHLGLDQDRVLAEAVPGIDLIVGGHSHTRLNEPVYAGSGSGPWSRGTPIVQTGAWGDRIGRVVLYVSEGRPSGLAYQLLPVRPAEGENPDVAAMLRPVADSVEVAMGMVVFDSDEYVPMPRHGTVESAIGNFAADVLRETAGADIGLMNTGGIRAPVPRGPVTVSDLYSVFPFDNTIVVVSMTGSRLRELLDFVARRLGKSNYAQVSGVSFTIAGDRAEGVKVGGLPLDSDRIYRVATIDYLYEGGDGYAVLGKAGRAEPTGLFQNEAAISFLRRHPDYLFRTEGRIVWEGSTPALRTIPSR